MHGTEYIARYSESDTTQNINRHELRTCKHEILKIYYIIQDDTEHRLLIYRHLKERTFRAKCRISVLLVLTNIKNLLVVNQRTSGTFITNCTLSTLHENKYLKKETIISSNQVYLKYQMFSLMNIK